MSNQEADFKALLKTHFLRKSLPITPAHADTSLRESWTLTTFIHHFSCSKGCPAVVGIFSIRTESHLPSEFAQFYLEDTLINYFSDSGLERWLIFGHQQNHLLKLWGNVCRDAHKNEFLGEPGAFLRGVREPSQAEGGRWHCVRKSLFPLPSKCEFPSALLAWSMGILKSSGVPGLSSSHDGAWFSFQKQKCPLFYEERTALNSKDWLAW